LFLSFTVPAPASSVRSSAAIASSIEPGLDLRSETLPDAGREHDCVIAFVRDYLGVRAEVEQQLHVRQVERLRRE
jgi:hypothetical protein